MTYTLDELLHYCAKKMGPDTAEGLILSCLITLQNIEEGNSLRARSTRRAVFQEIADIATEEAESI